MGMNKNSETILAVERALVLLKHLAEADEDVGVRDLGRELGYSPAVTQKLLNTLRAHNFVEQNEQTDRYRLGAGVLQLGLGMMARLDLVNVAQGEMESLTAETGETTFLAIRNDLHAVYVDKVMSPHAIRMDAEIGARRPLNCTAVGKILLAWADGDLVRRLDEEGLLEKRTPYSITSREQLQAELETVRHQGYAIDRQEYVADAMCVAAPIFNRERQLVGSITTSGPSFRIKDRIEEVAALVMAKADKISDALGYRAG
jgi:DNA-binding IclR family transcriptional regulator